MDRNVSVLQFIPCFTFLNYSANQISISQIPAERSNSTKAEL